MQKDVKNMRACGGASPFKTEVQRKNKNKAETLFCKSPKARF